jgi:hypothetical protein
MAAMGSQFMVEIEKVDARSKEKHAGENWRDMKLSYVFIKTLGHLLKWWWAVIRGSRYNGDGPHHMGKVGWYADKAMWIERYRPKQDDRPTNKSQMTLTFAVNVVKTVFDKSGSLKT